MEYSENEYIKLNRKIIRWEWYMNINVKTLFIHCLLKANWKDGRFEGKEIKRGSFVTSLEKLSVETGMSVRQIRTALDKLQMTGELTSKSYSKYRIITVVNYTQYQACDKQVDKQSVNSVTSKRQADDKQVTTIEEVKKERTKEVKKNNKPPISPFEELEKTDFSERIKGCLREWFEYKKEKKEKSYQTEMGFKKFVTQVRDAVERCGEEKVVKQFDYAMSRGWSGAYLDKIEPDKKQNSFDADSFMRRFEE